MSAASRHIGVALGALRAALMTLERGEIDRALRALDDAIYSAERARAELGGAESAPKDPQP